MTSVRQELAAAVRAVNAAWERVPAPYRPDPAPFDALEREVRAAQIAGDERRALAAIEAWRGLHVARFTAALANCPLEPRGAR